MSCFKMNKTLCSLVHAFTVCKTKRNEIQVKISYSSLLFVRVLQCIHPTWSISTPKTDIFKSLCIHRGYKVYENLS